MAEPLTPKIYQWLDEESRVALPAEIPKRTYDDKLVAFIDILGMRNKIRNEKNDAEEILTIMGTLQKYVASACDDLAKLEKLNYLQLGDGFIIVADLDCFDQLCEILSMVQWQVLIYTQNLVRGALTAGKVSMSDDSKLIIGPAFIEAFVMESENAIFPRILVSKEIQQYVPSGNMKFEYIMEDYDKLKYLDFIKYNLVVQKLNQKNTNHLFKTQGITKYLKEEYESKMVDKIHIAQKYGWLISKLLPHNIKII